MIKFMCPLLCVLLLGVLFRKMCPRNRALTNFLALLAVISASINSICSVVIFNVSCNFGFPQSAVIAYGIARAKLPSIDPSGNIVCIAMEWR